MAETPSTMLPLGTPAPSLRLTDAVAGRVVDAAEAARGKKGLLVAFICNHCPFVRHIRKELVRVAHAALDGGFAVLAVNSNDEKAFPEDGPAAMRRLAREEGWHFPFLFDETQEAAKAFRALRGESAPSSTPSRRWPSLGSSRAGSRSRFRGGVPSTGRVVRRGLSSCGPD